MHPARALTQWFPNFSLAKNLLKNTFKWSLWGFILWGALGEGPGLSVSVAFP